MSSCKICNCPVTLGDPDMTKKRKEPTITSREEGKGKYEMTGMGDQTIQDGKLSDAGCVGRSCSLSMQSKRQ